MPKKNDWVKNIQQEIDKKDKKKSSYYLIWLLNGEPVGHSNINYIEFGASAEMHLHLWKINKRKSGLGYKFLQLTISRNFEKFELNTIVCEPNSGNEAPNETLRKVGFRFIKQYKTSPSPIALYQTVNRYELNRNDFQLINTTTFK